MFEWCSVLFSCPASLLRQLLYPSSRRHNPTDRLQYDITVVIGSGVADRAVHVDIQWAVGVGYRIGGCGSADRGKN